MTRFDRLIAYGVLALPCMLVACSSPSMENEMRAALEGAGASSVDTSADSDKPEPVTKPKVVRLYFGSDETVHLTARTRVARFSFTGQRGGKISVVADGEAPVNLALLGRDPGDAEWRPIATAYSLHNPTIFDTPTALRSYRLSVTAADIGDFSLRLGCESDDMRKCAPARQPGEVCSGASRTATVMTCDDGLFCNLVRRTCGQGDQGGRCLRKPSDCPSVVAPVCGCDGETYASECRAQAAGMSTWRDGDCRDNPRPWDE